MKIFFGLAVLVFLSSNALADDYRFFGTMAIECTQTNYTLNGGEFEFVSERTLGRLQKVRHNESVAHVARLVAPISSQYQFRAIAGGALVMGIFRSGAPLDLDFRAPQSFPLSMVDSVLYQSVDFNLGMNYRATENSNNMIRFSCVQVYL